MNDFEALLAQKKELFNDGKAPRARQAAEQLGISEAQYVALSVGDTVTPLNVQQVNDVLQELESLGEMMALTRNAEMVMEHHGVYASPSFNHGSVIFNSPEIDLRLRTSAWKFAFAVNENDRFSLQFFDEQGVAAHKVYVTEQTDIDGFNALVAKYSIEVSQSLLDVVPAEESIQTEPNQVDVAALRQAWREMDNAHAVNAVLGEFGLTRPQAYQYLGDDALALQPFALKTFLTEVAENGLPLLMFVPNGSATQIHNGSIHKLLETGPWFNVLDPKFNLHAMLPKLSEAWMVSKYLQAGQATTSLEFFNQQGQAVMMIYLHPDVKEMPEWQQLWQQTTSSLINQEKS